MAIASFFMIRSQPAAFVPSPAGATSGALPDPQHHHWLMIPAEGLGVGVLTGFVGVGGGFLIIPALVLLGKLPMKEAIGTSLLIIAAKSGTGLLGYLN